MIHVWATGQSSSDLKGEWTTDLASVMLPLGSIVHASASQAGTLPHYPSLCLLSSSISPWMFLSRFLSYPEHTMATPLEDVGKQVGKPCPLPVAPEGLSRASSHLCVCVLSVAGVAGRPVPGRLYPVPKGPLPGMHRAGAWGWHRTRQHCGSHHGTHRLLYRQ